MATFTPGPLVGSLSGPLGSVVFSRHRGVPVIRSRRTHGPTSSQLSLLRRSQLQRAQAAWRALSDNQRLRYRHVAGQIIERRGPGLTYPLSGYTLFLELWISHVIQTGYDVPDDPTHLVAPMPTSFQARVWNDSRANVVTVYGVYGVTRGVLLDVRRIFHPAATRGRGAFRFVRFCPTGAPELNIITDLRAAIGPSVPGQVLQYRYRGFIIRHRPSAPQFFVLTVEA